VTSLPKTVTRQRRDCDLNPSLSAPESSTLTTCLPRKLPSRSDPNINAKPPSPTLTADPLPFSRSTQPCIPPGSLNRVPASAGVRPGMSPLPGGR